MSRGEKPGSLRLCAHSHVNPRSASPSTTSWLASSKRPTSCDPRWRNSARVSGRESSRSSPRRHFPYRAMPPASSMPKRARLARAPHVGTTKMWLQSGNGLSCTTGLWAEWALPLAPYQTTRSARIARTPDQDPCSRLRHLLTVQAPDLRQASIPPRHICLTRARTRARRLNASVS